MKRTRLKNFFRILAKIVGIILLILILLLLALRIPAVQTAITQKVTKILQKELNTEISIDRVAVNFIDNFCAEGIFLASQENDTLLYVEDLNIDIGFWKLFSNTIKVDDVSINNVVSQVKQYQDSTYNFEFLLNALNQEEPDPADTAGFLIIMDLNIVEMNNVDLFADLLIGKADLQFDKTYINFRLFDLDSLSLEFDEISIDKLYGSFVQNPSNKPIQEPNSEPTIIMEFPLKDLPFSLLVDDFSIHESSLHLSEKDFMMSDTFDTRYIFVDQLNIQLNDLMVNENELRGEMNEVTFSLNDAFEVQELTSTLLWNNEELSIERTRFNTGKSKFSLDAKSTYNSFDELINLKNSIQYDLNLSELDLDMNEISYFVPAIKKQHILLPLLSSDFKAKGRITGRPRATKLKNVEAYYNESFIKINGTVMDFLEVETLSTKDLEIKASAIYEDYDPFIEDRAFAQKLSKLGDLSLDGMLSGSMKEMNISALSLNTESLLDLELTGKVKRAMDMERLSYDFDIQRIRSGAQDVAIFLDTVPDIVTKFDTIFYRGNFKGTKYSYDLDGAFHTSLGDIETNAELAFNTTFDEASYKGRMDVDQFDLRTLLDNDSLTTITFTADFDGSGMELETIEADINAHVEQVGFNSYDYNNIDIKGIVDGKKFNGLANVDDENLKLDFKGVFDMNDSIPIMNFDLAMDTLNLKALNFYDEVLLMEFRLESELTGTDIDEMEGDVVIRDIVLTNEALAYFTDSITFTAASLGTERGIYFDSPFMNAKVEGHYTLAKLPEIIINFLDQYFPTKQYLGESPQENALVENQETIEPTKDLIKAEILIQDVLEIAYFLDIPISRMDSSQILFEIDVENNTTDFEMYVPRLIYNDIFIDSIYAYANNKSPEKVVGEFRIDSIGLSETMHIAEFSSDFVFQDQIAKVGLIVKSDADINSIGMQTEISSDGDQAYLINIEEPFYLNDKLWNVNQDSAIIVSSSDYSILGVLLANGEESLNLSGETGALNVDFENFALENFTEIIGMDSISVKGLMNGDVTVGLQDQIPIEGDLIINNVEFNEMDLGDFDLAAKKNGDEVIINVEVDGEMINTKAIFDFNLENQDVNGSAILRKFDLSLVNPFVSDYASNVEGMLKGNFDITGSIAKPDIFGKIDFTSVQAFIKPLETKYIMKDGSLNLYEDIIGVNAVLQDEGERLSYLEGKIKHTYFTDMKFDLNFNAEQFTFLDSQKSKKANFYGKFVAKVDAKITGDVDLPRIDANIIALEETDMTVQLLTGASAVSQENYMIFYDGNEIESEEAIDSIAKLKFVNEQYIDLNLTISTVEEALFHVIVDPITGDKLDIQGSSNLVVKMNDVGDFNITGVYTVTKGNYRLSYENTIKRNFAFDPGSQIVFQGDPLEALLDMRALYSTKTNTEGLVGQSGSAFSNESSSERVDVNVLLNVNGTLSKPDLSFDIQVAEDINSPIGSDVSTALSDLRQNETRLLEQVFSLILFNSFTGSTSGGNLTSVGTATAVSSIGNLVNQQLNKLTQKSNGFEIDFQLDQYNQGTESGNTNVTEFGIGLKQRLFDDRVEVSVGGNTNLETGAQSENSFSSFAGDFVIKYYLTKSGKYLVKVFQKSDYDALTSDSVWKTGIGLSYKTVFGKEKVNRF